MAARREVDGLLEEEIGPGQGAAERRQEIDLRQRQGGEGRRETLTRGVALQISTRSGHRLLEATVVGIVDLETRRHQRDRGPGTVGRGERGDFPDALARHLQPFGDARRRIGGVTLQRRLGRGQHAAEALRRRHDPQPEELQHHTAADDPAEARGHRFRDGTGRRARVAKQARRRAHRLLRVVADEHRLEDEVRLEPGGDGAEEQQFLDRSVALYTGIDHAVMELRSSSIESAFEQLAEGLAERHLHRKNQRITEQQEASFVGRLGTDRLVVPNAVGVDVDLGIELGRGETDPGVRLEPIAGRGITVEKALKGRCGLRVPPDAERGLEDAELRGENDGEDDGVARAAGNGGARVSAARRAHHG